MTSPKKWPHQEWNRIDFYTRVLEPGSKMERMWREMGGLVLTPKQAAANNLGEIPSGLRLGVTSHWDLAAKASALAGEPEPPVPPRAKLLLAHTPPENWNPHPGLFPFQKWGVWVLSLCPTLYLADDQGLGKTVQVAVALSLWKKRLENRGQWHGGIIYCPASVKEYWAETLMEWGKIPSCVVYGDRYIPELVSNQQEGMVYIINYRIARTWAPLQEEFQWSAIICDEAHRLKNPDSKTTKAVFGPKLLGCSLIRWCLSGTPMPNGPWELYAPYKWLNGLGVPSKTWWYKRYCDFKMRRAWPSKKAPLIPDKTGSSNEKELARRLRSTVFFRRTKKEVLPDLPPKLLRLQPMAFGGPNILEDYSKDLLRRVTGQEVEPSWEDPGGVERWKEILKRAQEDFLHSTYLSSRDLEELALNKTPEIVDFLLETEGKTIVWAWHHSILRLYSELLPKAVVYSGMQTPNQKKQAVEAFTQGEARFFVAQIRSAGVGLNLQVARRAVFAEISWVPTDLLQAEDRCHRIGTLFPPEFIYFVQVATIEEWVVRNLIRKQRNMERIIER